MKKKRVIIKIGSNILAGDAQGLKMEVISSLCRDIAEVGSFGFEAVVVSSGAVAAGMGKLGLKTKPRDIRLKQAAAAVGQSSLMWAYERGFAQHGRKVAQVLLTRDAFSDRKRYINAKNTLMALLSYNIIPIVNENDTVSTEEMQFGDNDQLASLAAIAVEADKLVILSDVDGLYDMDPRVHESARIIHSVADITPELEKTAGKARSLIGTGGMYSKVLAAKKAVAHGITVHIISGQKPGLIGDALAGKEVGTVFSPGVSKFSQRKGWIAHGIRSKGTVTVDDGARNALTGRGKSLLPSGIVSVEGSFEVGDAVYCVDSAGSRIAKGLTNYSSRDLRKIMGQKTTEIERILGFKYSDEVIHRDNLVLV